MRDVVQWDSDGCLQQWWYRGAVMTVLGWDYIVDIFVIGWGCIVDV